MAESDRSGAAGVTYTSARTRINNDNFGSSGRYPGASGANYVRIWFDNGPYFIVNDIALTPDQVDLTLSLGASFTAADCLIELSGDGSIGDGSIIPDRGLIISGNRSPSILPWLFPYSGSSSALRRKVRRATASISTT